MDLKEAERTVIAKPVASRPTISNFRSFSDPLASPTIDLPSSEPAITAIRPKTARFKSLTTSQAEVTGTHVRHLPETSNHTSPLLYKPLAKTVSKTTVSLLANMGTLNGSQERAVVAQNLASKLEITKDVNATKSALVRSENDKKPQSSTNNGRPSYDGYNWRKYGQKQVKGGEYPRSYYKCTHPSCVVKKKVERSIDGEIAEIVYKGEHNHMKPRLPRRHAFDGTNQDLTSQIRNNFINHDNEVLGTSSHVNNVVKLQECYDHHVSKERSVPNLECFCGVAQARDGSKVMMETANDVPANKKRKSLSLTNETYVEGLQEPRVVVHDGTDSEAISDGFRWRKYGQKVVKGNPYPRSYYRCTGVKCNVRKHVERASDDPSVFITSYEGKHNHEMPMKKAN
ncbi:WRKY transcription factor 44 isoform X1 [Rutidosis leptorrhynchoides]|uniref:WRKY transcription factor 44 isoform X1 n=1 Tax=Rutidosis leptorrhynchoides TaxID=125765 RepID=UPI003A99D63F